MKQAPLIGISPNYAPPEDRRFYKNKPLEYGDGGMSESVQDGETGILVPPEDVDALREAIATLMADDEMRGRMASAGRQRMQNEFSIATMADKHVELYESVLLDKGE